MAYDLLIKDAVIIDGTGAAPSHGDVAVRDGIIVDTGKLTGAARQVINAGGLTLTPGFVDIHTHYDGQVSWDSELSPSANNGVTSAGMGNCGVGFAPARRDWHEQLIALLEGVEDIPGTALTAGLTWDWESFPDYLDALERRNFAIDIGAHMPHAALRSYVMGERGRDPAEAPSEDEIAQMEEAVFTAVNAGAMGFSTSRTQAHLDRDGNSIGTLIASAHELRFAARGLQRAGQGVIQLISDVYSVQDQAQARSELDLIGMLARESGRPLSFTVMQSDQVPLRYRELLGAAARLSAEGLVVRAQVAPRGVGLLLGFHISTHPFYGTPTFRRIKAGPEAGFIRQLKQPEIRSQIIAELRGGNTEHTRVVGMLLRHLHLMFRMSDPVDYEPSEENSIDAEARRLGKDPLEHVYDVLLEDDGEKLLYQPVLNYADGNLQPAYEMMRDPNALFGLSDGGAHCGTICDASFPASALSIWTRGTRNGDIISLPFLVHGYTQRNARHVGWLDRGVIAPGYKADINLIDMDQLALPPPVRVRDLPAGGQRLLQTPRGIRTTVKAGMVTFEDGKWNGAAPGRLLRGAQERKAA